MDTEESSVSHLEQLLTRRDTTRQIALALTTAFPPLAAPVTREVNRHTNDTGLAQVWEEIASKLPGTGERNKSSIRIGMVVGSGGCPSIFAELLPNIDLLVFTDIDQRALDWIRFTCDALEKTKTLDGYDSRVYNQSNPLLKIASTNLGATSYIDESESLGTYHLLDTDQRYRQDREALIQAKAEGKQIVYVPIDLRDSQKGEQLGAILRPDSRVVYANFTNVAFHVVVNAISPQEHFSLQQATEGFRTTLSALPFDEGSIIQYSMMHDRRSSPLAKYTLGISNYLSDALRMPQA